MVKLRTEKDIEIVRQAAVMLEAENKRLSAELVEVTRELLVAKGRDPESLQLRMLALEQQLAKLRTKLFGTSSERTEADTTTEPSADKTKPTGHGPRAQLALPMVDVHHTVAEDKQVCTSCGGHLDAWDGQTEDAEEVDIIERQFVLKKHRRQKYRCRCGACIVTADGPEKLTPGSRYSVNFAIEVAVAKYLDHMPLERQVRIMGREGLVVDSQTLWDQIERLARVLAGPYARIQAHVLAQAVIGADETHWRLMGANGKDEGLAKRWHIWLAQCSDAVYYTFEDSRSADAAGRLLDGYCGTVMCDGYKVYSTLRKRGARFVLVHCWAHVRRQFVEIEAFFPKEVREVLPMINELFAIDAEAAIGPPGDEERRRLRAERSRPIVKRIGEWAASTMAVPESGLAKAIAYMTGLWDGLVRFLDDPQIPLSNNASERAARGPVVGRKNHYGSRSERGTEVAAVLYTLLESAKLAGVEPKAYLRRAISEELRGGQAPLPHELRTATTA